MAVPGLQATARQFHFSLPEERLPAFQALVDGFLAPYDRLDGLKEPRREPRHPRDSGARHGQRRTRWGPGRCGSASRAPHGPLAGRTLAVKDNMAVAGAPMRNGPVLLDRYVPDEDATVLERVLDAGAIILGKAVCESLCFSGAATATPPAGLRAHGCRR